MSFIYKDDNLILELLKLAQLNAPAVPNAPSATPVAPAASVQQTPAKTSPSPLSPEEQKIQLYTARQLLKNLQTQLSGVAVFTATRDDANVNIKNLINLDTLLTFLQFNGIKYNGKDIAIKSDMATMADMKEDVDAKAAHDKYADQLHKTGYFDYPIDKPTYYINKEGLEKYLRDLQSKKNPLLNASIIHLIDEVNNKLKFEFTKDPVEQIPAALPSSAYYMKSKPKDPKTPSEATTTISQEATTIKGIIDLLPLDSNHIDLNKIQMFLTSYKTLIANNDSGASATSNINNAETNINTIKTVSSNAGIFPLGSSTDDEDVMTFINKDQKQTAYYTLLRALYELVMNTSNVIRHFSTIYSDHIKKNTDWLDKINKQIANSGSCIYNNKTDLKRLINMQLPSTGIRS